MYQVNALSASSYNVPRVLHIDKILTAFKKRAVITLVPSCSPRPPVSDTIGMD